MLLQTCKDAIIPAGDEKDYTAHDHLYEMLNDEDAHMEVPKDCRVPGIMEIMCCFQETLVYHEAMPV